MMAYYITIVSVLVALCIAAIVIWAINSYYDILDKRAEEEALETSKGPAHVKNNDVYLRVHDGKVTVLEELPEAAVATNSVKYPYAEAKPDEAVISLDDTDEETEEQPQSESEGGEEKLPEKSFHESYMELSSADRDRYQKFTEYILFNKDCRKSESLTEITFKCKTDKVACAAVKHGTVELRFMLVNSDMHRYIRESGAKNIKIKPVVVCLDSDESLSLAEHTADITIKNYREEQYYRKQKRRDAQHKKGKN